MSTFNRPSAGRDDLRWPVLLSGAILSICVFAGRIPADDDAAYLQFLWESQTIPDVVLRVHAFGTSRVLILRSSSSFTVIDLQSGRHLWGQQFPDRASPEFLVWNDRLILVHNDGVTFRRLSDGQLIQRYAHAAGSSMMVLYCSDLVLLRERKWTPAQPLLPLFGGTSTLVAFDSTSGTELWRRTNLPYVSGIAGVVRVGSTVVVVTGRGLVRLSCETGAEPQEQMVGNPQFVTALIPVDDKHLLLGLAGPERLEMWAIPEFAQVYRVGAERLSSGAESVQCRKSHFLYFGSTSSRSDVIVRKVTSGDELLRLPRKIIHYNGVLLDEDSVYWVESSSTSGTELGRWVVRARDLESGTDSWTHEILQTGFQVKPWDATLVDLGESLLVSEAKRNSVDKTTVGVVLRVLSKTDGRLAARDSLEDSGNYIPQMLVCGSFLVVKTAHRVRVYRVSKK